MKKYLFKFKGLFFITTLLVIIFSFLNVALAFMFKYIIDLSIAKSIHDFIIAAIMFLLFCLVQFTIDLTLPIIKALYVKKTVIAIKEDIFCNVLHKSIEDFNENNSTNYLSILTTDLNMIEQDGINTIFDLIKYLFSFFIALISLLYINVPITIVAIIMSLINFLIPQLFAKKLALKRKMYSDSCEKFITKTKDLLSGFELIKTFNLSDKIIKIYKKFNNESEDNKFNFTCLNSIIGAITGNLGSLVYCVPIIMGGYYVVIGTMTVGTMIALFQLMGSIINPLSFGIKNINNINSLKLMFTKLDQLTKKTNEEKTKIQMTTFNKQIEFNNVTFEYKKNKPILNDINLKFEKNKKYAIVGESGCGKTTLLKLIMGYYSNFNGKIFIDETNLNAIDINSLYENISIIHQNIVMFDDTLKNNITLYKQYSDEEVFKSLENVGLSALIKNLEYGIYENVGDNGLKLSGGEKQRIAIARVLIKKSNIILLDEPTASLDNETSNNIENTILNLTDKTIISVTHKLVKNILNKYDEIIVLKDGRIIENGDFYTLIENKGYFYTLYNINNL